MLVQYARCVKKARRDSEDGSADIVDTAGNGAHDTCISRAENQRVTVLTDPFSKRVRSRFVFFRNVVACRAIYTNSHTNLLVVSISFHIV